jgi:hypothetical protein
MAGAARGHSTRRRGTGERERGRRRGWRPMQSHKGLAGLAGMGDKAGEPGPQGQLTLGAQR